MATVIKPNDPMLVAIKAELLHGLPELTGRQINAAAMLAVIAANRFNETSKPDYVSPDHSMSGWLAIDNPGNIT